LEVTIADLLGKQLLDTREPQYPEALLEFRRKYGDIGVTDQDMEMLARIHFRGDQPRTPEDWLALYRSIKAFSTSGSE